eukprot:TRINITY_DN9411_c0_g2_i1.p1 TRINITY_DN9411_c0_g2~~TRINITY_DN9411_c0_g2_i1.p1  ORF type:complete len:752 (-),score=139.68 TRINITY_DN9411_c0_g2_i1:937-3192(-)
MMEPSSMASPDRVCTLQPLGRCRVLALEKEFPFQGWISDTELRAITLTQLQRVSAFLESQCAFWHDTAPPEVSCTSGSPLEFKSLNLYHVNEWLIKPATLLRQCAFLELLTAREQPPQWYLSHWWGEPVRQFVACVQQHVLLRGLRPNTAFWLCAYANRQHSIKQELSSDPRESSFFKAMSLSEGMLLILDAKGKSTGPATPFTRIWCAYEAYVAIDFYNQAGGKAMQLDVATTHMGEVHFLTKKPVFRDQFKHPHDAEYGKAQREALFPLDVIRKGLVLKLEQAQASEEEDRRRILNCIAGRELDLPPLEAHANYNKVNCRLRSFFAEVAWRQAVDKGLVSALHLGPILREDTWRDSLTLDFSNCSDEMDDDSLATLAKHLPQNLSCLSLTFAYCENITSDGVEQLARHLPRSLTRLLLDFTGCQSVDDIAVASLWRHRPPNLHCASSMAIFKKTRVKHFNSTWDFSGENMDETTYIAHPGVMATASCSSSAAAETLPPQTQGSFGSSCSTDTDWPSSDKGRSNKPSVPILPSVHRRAAFASLASFESESSEAEAMRSPISPLSRGSRSSWGRVPERQSVYTLHSAGCSPESCSTADEDPDPGLRALSPSSRVRGLETSSQGSAKTRRDKFASILNRVEQAERSAGEAMRKCSTFMAGVKSKRTIAPIVQPAARKESHAEALKRLSLPRAASAGALALAQQQQQRPSSSSPSAAPLSPTRPPSNAWLAPLPPKVATRGLTQRFLKAVQRG